MLDMPKHLQRFRIGLLGHDYLRMTCANANCQQQARGWAIVLDPEDAKHVKAADHIKNDSGRRYVELRSEDAAEYLSLHGTALGVDMAPLRALVKRTPPGMLLFVFPPGQQCFRVHKDREVVFVHDARDRQRVHTPLGFNEDFNDTAYRTSRLIEQG